MNYSLSIEEWLKKHGLKRAQLFDLSRLAAERILGTEDPDAVSDLVGCIITLRRKALELPAVLNAAMQGPSNCAIRAQALMIEPSKLWLKWTGQLPAGIFDPDAEHCSPGTDNGAEFVARVLDEADCGVSTQQIEANLPAIHLLLAAWRDRPTE